MGGFGRVWAGLAGFLAGFYFEILRLKNSECSERNVNFAASELALEAQKLTMLRAKCKFYVFNLTLNLRKLQNAPSEMLMLVLLSLL